MDANFVKKINKIHKMIVDLKNNNQDFFSNLFMEMNIKSNGVGNVLSRIPSENCIKLFMIDFRPFLLQGEFAHFQSLCNFINKEVKNYDEDIINIVNDFKNNWNDFLNGTNIGGVSTKIDNTQILVKDKIDLWLNGKFMHPTDVKGNKHEELSKINVPLFGPMDYFFFLDILQRLAFLLFSFDEKVLKIILDDYE